MTFKRIACVVALLVGAWIAAAIVKYVLDERRAQEHGFTRLQEAHDAERTGIQTKEEWVGDLATKQQEEASAKAEQRKREAAALEVQKKRERAELFKAIHVAIAQAIPRNRVEDLEQAYGVINDFRLMEKLVARASTEETTTGELQLISQLDTKVKVAKRLSFPALRASFGPSAAKKLWVEDFEVTTGGYRNERITFFHPSFVLRKNIETAHEKLLQSLLDFNFQRACYSWARPIWSQTYCYNVAESGAP